MIHWKTIATSRKWAKIVVSTGHFECMQNSAQLPSQRKFHVEMCNNCVVWCHPLQQRPSCMSIAPMLLNGSNGRHECSISIAYRYMKTRLVVWGSGKVSWRASFKVQFALGKSKFPGDKNLLAPTPICVHGNHSLLLFQMRSSDLWRWFARESFHVIPVSGCAAIWSARWTTPRQNLNFYLNSQNTSIVACRTNQEQWCLQSSKGTLLGLQR